MSGRDRRLLLAAFVALCDASIIVHLLPVSALRQAIFPSTGRNRRKPQRYPLDRVVWAIDVAARFTPGASCLVRSIAACTILNRSGHSATLRIGVKQPAGEPFQAHAWVEVEGKTVLNGSEGYSAFPAFCDCYQEALAEGYVE